MCTMFYLLTFIFFLTIICNPVQSGCDDSDGGMFKNVKPTKNDYIGQVMNRFHNTYVGLARNFPNWEGLCNTFLLPLGTLDWKASLKPRGCCSACCRVKNPAEFVQIYFVKMNGKEVQIKLTEPKKAGALKAMGVDSKLPTIFYLHGYGENGKASLSAQFIMEAYIKTNQTVNMFKVDWSELGALPWYKETRDNTKLIAPELVKFLKFYHTTGELPIDKIHMVGLSLGSQIAGRIGKALVKFKKLPRITGLDPAFPLYSLTDKSERLCEDDAEFVDIIHTNPGFFGFPISIGHVDFYSNYNQTYQPGCDFFDRTRKGYFYESIICEHVRAVELYAISILDPHAFPLAEMRSASSSTRTGRSIKNTGYMGVLANNRTTMGEFYLDTNKTHWNIFNDLRPNKKKMNL